MSIFLFISAFFNVAITFICQNYNLRKDYLCCKSVSYLLLFKISVIVAYSTNCIGYYIVNKNQFLLLGIICVHFLLSLILLIAYIGFGYYIYRHTVSQVLQAFLVCLYLSLSSGCLYDHILNIVEG